MAGRKRSAPVESSPGTTRASARAGSQSAASRSSSRRTRTQARADAAIPEVYREMLVEARAEMAAQDTGAAERPLKRRRPGEGRVARRDAPKEDSESAQVARSGSQNSNRDHASADGVARGTRLELEDTAVPEPTVQTIVRESDDEDEDEDEVNIDFEDVVIEPAASSSAATGEGSQGLLSLDLSAHMASKGPRRADRRKAIGKEERVRRVLVHKTHLLCLLAHVERRNRWCNDPDVQDSLRPLLPQKTVDALLPRASLNQFGRTESLKAGLQEARQLFSLKFSITERGLRRALWAEDEEQLKNVRRYPQSEAPVWARLINITSIVSTSGRCGIHPGEE